MVLNWERGGGVGGGNVFAPRGVRSVWRHFVVTAWVLGMHLVGRGQECRQTPCSVLNSPRTKSNETQKVSGPEAGKLCPKANDLLL